MPVTSVSDVVVPEVYDDYFMENSIHKSALWRSGIVTVNPQFVEKLRGGARQFALPFWQSNVVIGANATPVRERDVIAPDEITGAQMNAYRQFREKAFGQNDLASVLAGSDPLGGIINLTEAFWNRNYQRITFLTVRGVIADNVANFASDLAQDITGAVAPADEVNTEAVIDAVGLFGDADNDLQAIAIHSVPYNRLRKDNLIDTRPDNEQNIGWGTYLGKTVIVDDMLVAAGPIYWTILFKQGAIGFGEVLEGAGYTPTEVERNPAISGGQTLYYTRRVFLLHPNGFSYVAPTPPDADSPTDDELLGAAQWTRAVASPKNCGFSVLLSSG